MRFTSASTVAPEYLKFNFAAGFAVVLMSLIPFSLFIPSLEESVSRYPRASSFASPLIETAFDAAEEVPPPMSPKSPKSSKSCAKAPKHVRAATAAIAVYFVIFMCNPQKIGLSKIKTVHKCDVAK